MRERLNEFHWLGAVLKELEAEGGTAEAAVLTGYARGYRCGVLIALAAALARVEEGGRRATSLRDLIRKTENLWDVVGPVPPDPRSTSAWAKWLADCRLVLEDAAEAGQQHEEEKS